MGNVKTYSSRQVMIAFGNHSVSGYADDSFVTIEAKGDGVMSKTGCDGEIARAIDPNDQYSIKVVVLQTSPTNKFLQDKYTLDKKTGNGTFPVLIKDLKGGTLFSCDEAWVTKPASRVYGKDTNNREWTIETGAGELKEG